MRVMMCAAAVAVLVALVSPARAQNAAQAERLFREGKTLVDAGKLKEACEAFEASQRLDPSLATLANVANCREKRGDLATAWEAYVAVERQTDGLGKYEALYNLAHAKVAALEPRLSYLTINVPDEVRVDGLEVFRDGVLIQPGAWNRALPVDGGPHTISGRAPGHETWSTVVTIAPEADKQAVEVPRFKAIRNPLGGGKTVIVDRTRPSMFTARRKVAVGVAAGGVVALAAGAVLGVRARGLADDADNTCRPETCTLAQEARAEQLSEDASTTALRADVALGVGLAAIAAGAVLWLTGAPPAPADRPGRVAVEPRLAPGFTGVTAAVRF